MPLPALDAGALESGEAAGCKRHTAHTDRRGESACGKGGCIPTAPPCRLRPSLNNALPTPPPLEPPHGHCRVARSTNTLPAAAPRATTRRRTAADAPTPDVSTPRTSSSPAAAAALAGVATAGRSSAHHPRRRPLSRRHPLLHRRHRRRRRRSHCPRTHRPSTPTPAQSTPAHVDAARRR